MTGINKAIRLQWENLRSLAFGSIGASYTQVGAVFANPILILKIYNGTNEDVFLSDDGTNDKDIIPQGVTFQIDISSNKVNNIGLFQKAGSALFIKEGPDGAPASGSVFVTALHANQI